MLNDQIRETILQVRKTLPAEMSALIEQGAGEISALDIIENAKKKGDAAPSFSLLNQNGLERKFEKYLADGPCVITFYRGVWCPYCNLQLKAYAERIAEIESLGAGLVALSPEKPDALDILKSNSTSKEAIESAPTDLPFDVLFDEGNQVAQAYGLVFELPESHKTLLNQLGVDIEAMTGSNTYTFPDPATYIVNTEGTIVWAYVPNNYRKRAEVDSILDAIKHI